MVVCKQTTTIGLGPVVAPASQHPSTPAPQRPSHEGREDGVGRGAGATRRSVHGVGTQQGTSVDDEARILENRTDPNMHSSTRS